MIKKPFAMNMQTLRYVEINLLKYVFIRAIVYVC